MVGQLTITYNSCNAEGSNSNCPSCDKSGSYTLYPMDGDSKKNRLLGINIPITASADEHTYSYWLQYRGFNDAKIGLSVHLGWLDKFDDFLFHAGWNQLNYDAHGDTDILEDSFVLPGTCYHVSPNVRILDVDPLDAMRIQPVVCVDSLEEEKKIEISVDFHDLDTPEEGDEVYECGSNTKNMNLAPGESKLIHVRNTGANGVVSVELCPSSGDAKAYFYDRCVYYRNAFLEK